MATKLIVVRHGKAQTRKPERNDEERQLTSAGKRSFKARLPWAADLFAREHADEVAVWTSPAVRAVQTTELLIDAFRDRVSAVPKQPKEMECLWTQDVTEFMKHVRMSPADVVIAVGHNPFIEEVAHLACGSTIDFATGAIAALSLPSPSEANETVSNDAANPEPTGRLLWFVQGPESKCWKRLAEVEDILSSSYQNVETRLAAFLENPSDVECAHKFRVSIRTMRGLLSFVRPFQKAAQNDRMRSNLREAVICTSRLREYDVLIEEVAALEPPASELLEACAKAREKECGKVLSTLKTKKMRKRLKSVRDDVSNIEWKGSVSRGGLDERAIVERFEVVSQRVGEDLNTLDLSDVERTHDVRKRAKQVRYAAENFKSQIGESADMTATQMKAAQDRLGALCDARVNVDIVDNFPRKGLSDQALQDLARLREQNETYINTVLSEA